MKKILFFKKPRKENEVVPLYAHLEKSGKQIELMKHIVPEKTKIIKPWELNALLDNIGSNRVHFDVNKHSFVRNQIGHRFNKDIYIFCGSPKNKPEDYAKKVEGLLPLAKERGAIAWLDIDENTMVSLEYNLGIFLNNFLRSESLENELYNQVCRA